MKRNILIGIPFIIVFLIGSWAFVGPLKGSVPTFFGKNPLMHFLILLGVCLYGYLIIVKPRVAKKSAKDSIKTLKKLFLFIVAALFIAGAALTLVPKEALAGFLGEEAGLVAVFIGVAIGSILPACPFISYPIIAGVYGAGAGFPGIMGMLFGAGLAFPCYLTNDLTYFGSKVLAVRMALTFLAATTAGILVYLVLG